MAEPFRLCLFHSELSRKAPGLLYRDITSNAPSVVEAADRIARGRCDVLGLLGFDYDYNGVALSAFIDTIIAQGGPSYPYRFALRPNVGWPSFIDLDMDGRLGTPSDAQSYGRFSGEGGMAILSQVPIIESDAKDFSQVLWRDLPWATLPKTAEGPFFSEAALAKQRLSTTGHWVVPIRIDGAELKLLLYHASPPVFDGPEDRNGLRNADETLFWLNYIEQQDLTDFAILGAANLDPVTGDGRNQAMRDLLDSPRISDPFQNMTRPDRLTVDWSDIDLGRMRTDYIMPFAEYRVTSAGTIWPRPEAQEPSRHALVWVELSQAHNETSVNLETSAASK